MKHLTIVLIISSFALLACAGDQGPAGPQGPVGPPGPGSRVVYQSTTEIPNYPNPYCINVPEIKLNNMPVVSVYLGDASGTWVEIPLYSDVEDYTMAAFIDAGVVCLYNCRGWYYKIVIVT